MPEQTIFVVLHAHSYGITTYTMSSQEKADEVVEKLHADFAEDFEDETDSCEIVTSILDEY